MKTNSRFNGSTQQKEQNASQNAKHSRLVVPFPSIGSIGLFLFLEVPSLPGAATSAALDEALDTTFSLKNPIDYPIGTPNRYTPGDGSYGHIRPTSRRCVPPAVERCSAASRLGTVDPGRGRRCPAVTALQEKAKADAAKERRSRRGGMFLQHVG